MKGWCDLETLEGLLVGEAELVLYMREQMDHALKILEMPPASDSLMPGLLVVTKVRPSAKVERGLFLLATSFNSHEEKHAIMRNLGFPNMTQGSFRSPSSSRPKRGWPRR